MKFYLQRFAADKNYRSTSRFPNPFATLKRLHRDKDRMGIFLFDSVFKAFTNNSFSNAFAISSLNRECLHTKDK